MEEILNIFWHQKHMAVKALNRAKTVPEAAKLLGISERCLHRWKREFNIRFDEVLQLYFLEEEFAVN